MKEVKPNTIDTKAVKYFVENHRELEISAAKIEYSMYMMPEIETMAMNIVEMQIPMSEKDLAQKEMIESVATPEELLQLMRKEMCRSNRIALRQKLLLQEVEMLPLIQGRCQRTLQDVFIEDALHFFLHAETNCCDWILAEYDNFRSEYLKSLFCLVLGIRGDVGAIPFLMEEAKRLERLYPDEGYDQGPAIAVEELAARFLND